MTAVLRESWGALLAVVLAMLASLLWGWTYAGWHMSQPEVAPSQLGQRSAEFAFWFPVFSLIGGGIIALGYAWRAAVRRAWPVALAGAGMFLAIYLVLDIVVFQTWTAGGIGWRWVTIGAVSKVLALAAGLAIGVRRR